MLTPAQIEEFQERGLVGVPKPLSEQGVGAARAALASALDRLGVWRDPASQVQVGTPPNFPMPGVSARQLGRLVALDALIDEAGLLDAVAMLDRQARENAKFGRPQCLVTLPNAREWHVPHGMWHVDFPRLASGLSPGVQLFACLGQVEAQGGGTLVVAGSHRLLNTGQMIRSKDIKQFLARNDFFRALFNAQEERSRIGDWSGAVGGVRVEVVELTGAPGDACLMDLRVLHTIAPNASRRPRMMMTHRFIRADCVAQPAGSDTPCATPDPTESLRDPRIG